MRHAIVKAVLLNGDWVLNVTCMRVAQEYSVGLRCVVRRHPNLDFCATSRSLVTTRCKSWCLLSCFVCWFFYFRYVCCYLTEDEMEDVSPNSGKLEFYLTVHETSSCLTASVSVIFSFLQNVRCTLTYTVNQQIIIIIIIFLKYYGSYEFLHVHSLTTTQGLSASCPSKPLRIFTQADFHVVTHHAYSSVIAWLLKTKP